jgi:PEP-CTERM motif
LVQGVGESGAGESPVEADETNRPISRNSAGVDSRVGCLPSLLWSEFRPIGSEVERHGVESVMAREVGDGTMSGNHTIRTSGALLAVCLAWAQSSFAVTIKDIVDGGGMITSGKLKFTFDKDSVSGMRVSGPITADQIDVNIVAGGIEFSPNPMIDLKSNQKMDEEVTITYTVMATVGAISRAGLSFTGYVEVAATSEVTKTFIGRNEELHVFMKQDGGGNPTSQNNQSVDFADMPTMLSVKEVGHVGTSLNQQQRTAQLTSMTNTFLVVPEPSTVLLGSIGFLGVVLVSRKRRSAAPNDSAE